MDHKSGALFYIAGRRRTDISYTAPEASIVSAKGGEGVLALSEEQF